MGRMHVVIPNVGVLTLHTNNPFNEIHILGLDKSIVETYYYEVNPTDIERQFIKCNKKVWG